MSVERVMSGANPSCFRLLLVASTPRSSAVEAQEYEECSASAPSSSAAAAVEGGGGAGGGGGGAGPELRPRR